MNSLRNLLAAGAIVAGLLPASQALAMDAGDRQEVEKIVREYLLANPQILIEMRDALETRRKVEQEAKQRQTLAAEKDTLYSARDQIVIGPADAKITVIEFFDYNCGFCQRALEDMNRLVDDGSSVRFIMKEFPVLGDDSLQASRISIAFNRLLPQKAAEFHRLLLGAPGHKDGAMAIELGVKLGADRDTLKAEAEKQDITDAIGESYRLGDGLGISGTPSYVIGEEVVFGAVGFDSLFQKVANLGVCGKTIC